MKIPANGFTHAGKFHADDVFATALLQIIRPDITATRVGQKIDFYDLEVLANKTDGEGGTSGGGGVDGGEEEDPLG